MLDITSHSLGIKDANDDFALLIEKNTTIPTKKSRSFVFPVDEQNAIAINVFQGDKKVVSKNKFLGSLALSNLPDKPESKLEIAVTFDIWADHELYVSVKEIKTGKEVKKTITVEGGLDPEQIDKLTLKINELESSGKFDCYAPYVNIQTAGSILPTNYIQSQPVTESRKKIFISYAHTDKPWVEKILTHLAPVKRKFNCVLWTDRELKVGEYWKENIMSNIESADIAILLVTSNFMSSDFIINEELEKIFAEKELKYITLFPVSVGYCAYHLHEDLEKFQFFNDPKSPLDSMKSHLIDKLLVELADEISHYLK